MRTRTAAMRKLHQPSRAKRLCENAVMWKKTCVIVSAFGAINWAILIGAASIPQPHLRLIGSVVAQAIITIFATAAFVVFYFSCRCKHENFDLTLLAQSVGVEAPDQGADKTTPKG